MDLLSTGDAFRGTTAGQGVYFVDFFRFGDLRRLDAGSIPAASSQRVSETRGPSDTRARRATDQNLRTHTASPCMSISIATVPT
jgi:hypothetical protein